jgi:hypothetical protein
MTQPTQTAIRCGSCGQPVPAQVRTVLDAQSDPQGKSLLVAGRLNAFQCPNCGFVNQVLTPLLYHDASKQLLIAFIPMEVSMQSGRSEEKIVGDLLNELTRTLPKEQFRSYMFNPKRALTLQGLIEQVMEADGVTKDMLDQQKKRVDLIQALLAVSSEEELDQIIQKHDSDIDLPFFQTLALMTQRVAQDGRQDIVAGLVAVQEALLERSTYGQQIAAQKDQQEQVVREVAEAINNLGAQATRADLVRLAVSFADDDEKLQALVGLVRGAFDYEFFLEFMQAISQAPAGERDRMAAVRDRIQSLAETMDEQAKASLQETAQFLQMLVNSPQQDQMIEENIDLIDNTFMAILNANLQEAQRRGDSQTFEALEALYRKVVEVLQARMSPELRFINELLSAESEPAMVKLLQGRIGEFDDKLLATCDAVAAVLQEQGQAGALQRLGVIRQAIAQHLS